jgi:hypothetical protein
MDQPSVPRILGAAAAALTGLALLAGCAGSTSPKPPAPTAKPSASASAPVALASLPAAQILSKALAAANAVGSVHLNATARTGSSSGVYHQNVSSAAGNQVITNSDGGQLTVLVVAGVGYLRGNAISLGKLFRGHAISTLTGRWISVRPGEPGYHEITGGITLSSVMSEFMPAGPLTSTGPRTVDGRPVIGVRGTAPAVAGVPQGQPVTLYVAAAGLPLPVSYQAGTGPDQATATFSRWGQAVHVAAPANPLPISSVTGS